MPHAVNEPKNLDCHDIEIVAGTRLSSVLGDSADAACSCRVNSRHHQSVGRTGNGLVVSARAADGVVEAIEKPDAAFCIGVQWHPENFWESGEFRPLFDAFVEAARVAEWSAYGSQPGLRTPARHIRIPSAPISHCICGARVCQTGCHDLMPAAMHSVTPVLRPGYEHPERLHVRRVREQIECRQRRQLIPPIDETPRVARHRGGIARHVNHSRRGGADDGVHRIA